MLQIHIMGQAYDVPQGLTILTALEWAGFRMTRGVGCRGGFCGACGTVYRLQGDYRLRYALACQTVVEPDMVLGQISFFPAQRPSYRLESLEAGEATLAETFPEILRCFGCNTCTKSCPQELDVLGYMADAVRGDLPALADASFDCIMCGLCVARCPADLVPPNVALLGRRLYGRYLAPRAEHLRRRLDELEAGAFRQQLTDLKSLSREDLMAQYEAREIEA